jgi:hypothetical protein
MGLSATFMSWGLKTMKVRRRARATAPPRTHACAGPSRAARRLSPVPPLQYPPPVARVPWRRRTRQPSRACSRWPKKSSDGGTLLPHSPEIRVLFRGCASLPRLSATPLWRFGPHIGSWLGRGVRQRRRVWLACAVVRAGVDARRARGVPTAGIPIVQL